MGHTRHATQGTLKYNGNNHPFKGRCGRTEFALAHSGIICNDKRLRKDLRLPSTKISTDSYIAVHLLERQKQIDFNSIKYMAEKVDGSYSFTILDNKNNLHIVKGDSPVSIFHFPEKKVYVYNRIQGIEDDLADIDKQINNIVNVVAQTGSTALTDKLKELEQVKAEKLYVLSSLQEQLYSVRIDDNSLKMAFQKAKNVLKNGNLATQELIVNTYVNCVKLYPDKIEIVFNLMPNYTVKDTLSKEKIST